MAYERNLDESALIKESSVLVMHDDLSDLASLILAQIAPNKYTLFAIVCLRFVVISSGTCLLVALWKNSKF